MSLDVVRLAAPRPPAGALAFEFAELVPARGMMTLRLRARDAAGVPIDVLGAPEDALARLEQSRGEFPANEAFAFGAAILLPFANRIRGRRDEGGRTIAADVQGRRVTLPANWGGRASGAERYAMHGLLLDASGWTIERRGDAAEDRVSAVLDAGDFGGHWPSRTRVVVEHALSAARFALRVTATNAGDEALPIGIGWHPYFMVPSGARNAARLRVPARRRVVVGDYDQVLPTGAIVATAETPYDFAAPEGRALNGLFLDDCFVDLERDAAEEVVATLRDPQASYRLDVIGRSPEIQAVQVYAPPDHAYVAIEPQFNLADPFGDVWPPGTDTGMVTLAPGGAVSYDVRLELHGA